ncbi:hypothetical protein Q5752_005355 [Cryptotrichosporon argae]
MSTPTSATFPPGPSRAASSAAPGTGARAGQDGGGGGEGSGGGGSGTLWSDILRSADRAQGLGKKNVLVLSERHRGRATLLDQLVGKAPKRGARASARERDARRVLAMGYEVLEGSDDEDAPPSVSLFFPPSSDRALLGLVRTALPASSVKDTVVVVVLDWTRPGSMIKELVSWLAWIDEWASEIPEDEGDELRKRLQSLIQHYVEPPAPGIAAASSSLTAGTLLPLGPGTLTLNPSGVPIVVVCTKADLMDATGDELGMKGGWEERTDWVQQVLRTICLAHGAALFYTAPTQPASYRLLRSYLLHRLYTVPPPLEPESNAAAPLAPARAAFPFPHRANVLDRDAVLVPTGWDSHGKIAVLRDGFEAGRVEAAWRVSLGRRKGADADGEGVEDLWDGMIPDTESGPKPAAAPQQTVSEPEQAFLARHLDVLLKDPTRDPRASFRPAAAGGGIDAAGAATVQAAHAAAPGGAADRGAGVVGPMGAGGLSLPGVEKVMAEMEGEGRLRKDAAKALSPGDKPAVPNEALHNFFQGLLATRTKTATPKADK